MRQPPRTPSQLPAFRTAGGSATDALAPPRAARPAIRKESRPNFRNFRTLGPHIGPLVPSVSRRAFDVKQSLPSLVYLLTGLEGCGGAGGGMAGAAEGSGAAFTSRSSTSKVRVAPPGTLGGAPRSP